MKDDELESISRGVDARYDHFRKVMGRRAAKKRLGMLNSRGEALLGQPPSAERSAALRQLIADIEQTEAVFDEEISRPPRKKMTKRQRERYLGWLKLAQTDPAADRKRRRRNLKGMRTMLQSGRAILSSWRNSVEASGDEEQLREVGAHEAMQRKQEAITAVQWAELEAEEVAALRGEKE